MSFTDPNADPVQPDEGQGGSSNEGGHPWDAVLNHIPEEARGEVEPVLREWDGNYTRAQQEAADYRKTWEPYEQAGVSQLDPDTLSQLIQFNQGLQENPAGSWESMQEWARSNGLLEQAQQGEEQWVDPQVQALQDKLAQLEQGYSQFGEWQQSVQQQAETDAIAGAIGQAFETQKAKHPDFDDDDLVEVEKLVEHYWDPRVDPADVVEKAFSGYGAVLARHEKRVLAGKTGVPPATAGGGAPPGAGPPQTMAEANDVAAAQLRAMFNR